MKSSPRVSIITVCLNSVEYLEGAIKSVIGQTYKDTEYIVIDGGSKDGTHGILHKYSDSISRVVIEKDRGIFDAMNKGIGIASGEIIYFLNSDDRLYRPDTVEKAVRFFIKNKDADFIYGDIEVFDPADNLSYIERYPDKIGKWLFITRTIAQPGTFFRADCFKRCGCFDTSYTFAADHDWYLRAVFAKGSKGAHAEHVVSLFRVGGNSTQDKNMDACLYERDLIHKKYFNILELSCARLLFWLKKLLGKRINKFLHRLRVHCFGRDVKTKAGWVVWGYKDRC